LGRSRGRRSGLEPAVSRSFSNFLATWLEAPTPSAAGPTRSRRTPGGLAGLWLPRPPLLPMPVHAEERHDQ
jgi:hypothetical protein